MFEFYRGIRLVLLAVVPAFVVVDQPAHGAELLSKYSVLSVGINQYVSKGLNPLRGCVNDAKSMAELFGGQDVVAPLINGNATKARILSEFEKLGQTAPERGNVMIFLAGHGIRDEATWRFCPHDYDALKPEETGLQGGEILAAIQPLQSKHCRILMILDSCHSGEFVKQCGFQFRSLNRPEIDGGLIVLSSCAPTQSSWDGEAHGLFTGAVLSAFSIDADLNNRDETLPENKTVKVSLNEVRHYLNRELRKAVFLRSKLPGMAYSEQEFLADWSMSISDIQVLMEYVRPLLSPFQKAREAERSNELHRSLLTGRTEAQNRLIALALITGKPEPSAEQLLSPYFKLLRVAETTETLKGDWALVRPIVRRGDASPPADATEIPEFLIDADGNKLMDILLLSFDGQGNYRARHQIGHEDPVSTTGHYEFEPGKRFRLVFGNGSDSLGLKSLSTDELVIEIDPAEYAKRHLCPSPFYRPSLDELLLIQGERVDTFTFQRIGNEE